MRISLLITLIIMIWCIGRNAEKMTLENTWLSQVDPGSGEFYDYHIIIRKDLGVKYLKGDVEVIKKDKSWEIVALDALSSLPKYCELVKLCWSHYNINRDDLFRKIVTVAITDTVGPVIVIGCEAKMNDVEKIYYIGFVFIDFKHIDTDVEY